MMLTSQFLLEAYRIGFFPMAGGDPMAIGDRAGFDASELLWFNPERRGIIPLEGFHLPRRLRRVVGSGKFSISCNQNFEAVIEGCARLTARRDDSWINDTIRAIYTQLHRDGLAHSLEVWLEDCLVGGLYGVAWGGVFFGESMFARKTDASKVALVHLVARLRYGGFILLDIQFVNDHLRQFGAIEIKRTQYLELLGQGLEMSADFPNLDGQAAIEIFLAAKPVS